jgi:hypothetical protein
MLKEIKISLIPYPSTPNSPDDDLVLNGEIWAETDDGWIFRNHFQYGRGTIIEGINAGLAEMINNIKERENP